MYLEIPEAQISYWSLTTSAESFEKPVALRVAKSDWLAIHQHGTRAAHADATTFFCADQSQIITQDFEQCPRPFLDLVPASVYIQNHR